MPSVSGLLRKSLWIFLSTWGTNGAEIVWCRISVSVVRSSTFVGFLFLFPGQNFSGVFPKLSTLTGVWILGKNFRGGNVLISALEPSLWSRFRDAPPLTTLRSLLRPLREGLCCEYGSGVVVCSVSISVQRLLGLLVSLGVWNGSSLLFPSVWLLPCSPEAGSALIWGLWPDLGLDLSETRVSLCKPPVLSFSGVQWLCDRSFHSIYKHQVALYTWN